MTALGDKLAGAAPGRLAIGVPTVPGAKIAGADAARLFAGQAGFPILIKAVAGVAAVVGCAWSRIESQLDAALEAPRARPRSSPSRRRVFSRESTSRGRVMLRCR